MMVKIIEEIDYDISQNKINDLSRLEGRRQSLGLRKEREDFITHLRSNNYSTEEINDFSNKFGRELRNRISQSEDKTDGTKHSELARVFNSVKVENLRGELFTTYQLVTTTQLKDNKFSIRNINQLKASDFDRPIQVIEDNDLTEPPYVNILSNLKVIRNYIKEEKDDFGEAEERDKLRTGRFRTKVEGLAPLDFDFVYGAIDVTKTEYRKMIYEHWDKTASKYTPFRESFEKFVKEVTSAEKIPGKVAMKLTTFFKKYENVDLEYIGDFDIVNSKHYGPLDRFFNTVGQWMVINDILEDISELDARGDTEQRDSDMSAEELQQDSQREADEGSGREVLEEQVSEGSLRAMGVTAGQDEGATMADLKYKDAESEEIGDSMQDFLESIDPLLKWELERDTKLIALTKQSLDEINDYIYEELEDIQSGEKTVPLTFEHKLNQWADEVDDTVILSKDEVDKYALPYSVMGDSTFKKIMGDSNIKGVITRNSIKSDIGDTIKEFFNDLYDILRQETEKVTYKYTEDNVPKGKEVGDKYTVTEASDSFAFHVSNRTTKGQPKGTVVDWREAAGSGRPELARTSNRPSDKGYANIKEEYKALTKSLKEFIEKAMDYFITPLQSGFIVVNSPEFMDGVGSRGIDTWAKDIGLENVFGMSWEKLARGSAKEITATSLEDIANFLMIREQDNSKIDNNIFVAGARAVRALTKIFGKSAEDEISNEVGFMIYSMMNEIEDTSREDKKFPKRSNVTIFERAVAYSQGMGKRRWLVLLRNYLSINQGVITQNDAKKVHYDKIMDFFSQKQQDLPDRLKKLLKAHDIIRGQLGKKVVYGFLNIHSDFDGFINKMYQEERVDLSNLEVENIVKSDDAHSNISKEYGISADQVYLIKANFRA